MGLLLVRKKWNAALEGGSLLTPNPHSRVRKITPGFHGSQKSTRQKEWFFAHFPLRIHPFVTWKRARSEGKPAHGSEVTHLVGLTQAGHAKTRTCAARPPLETEEGRQ